MIPVDVSTGFRSSAAARSLSPVSTVLTASEGSPASPSVSAVSCPSQTAASSSPSVSTDICPFEAVSSLLDAVHPAIYGPPRPPMLVPGWERQNLPYDNYWLFSGRAVEYRRRAREWASLYGTNDRHFVSHYVLELIRVLLTSSIGLGQVPDLLFLLLLRPQLLPKGKKRDGYVAWPHKEIMLRF